MTNRVLRLAMNTIGRDFVVGDIHGAYDLIWEGMKAVNFNKEVDRILSVGDLIDRGKGSARCVAFLEQPYVFAISGNHERMMIEVIQQSQQDGQSDRTLVDALAQMNFNGMRWMKDVSIDKLIAMAEILDSLPFVIEVETERGLVGLVHADVPMGMHWQDFTLKIEEGDPYCTRMALGMDVSDSFHESRQRVETGRSDGVPGVGRVFVGHTVLLDGLKRLGNVYAVDTGAVFGDSGKGKGHLTMVNPLMCTSYLIAPQERTNPLLDLRVMGNSPARRFSPS